jgi:ethanolamine ammonia-lyase large subunit
VGSFASLCESCHERGNYTEADADDIDSPLNYQRTSFYDARYHRRLLGLKPAPEFEAWLASESHAEIKRLGRPSLLLP